MLFRSQENRRRVDPRRRLRPILGAAAIAGLLGAIYLGREHFTRWSSQAARAVIQHPYFSVREIQVRGAHRLGGSEVVAMAGLTHGMNIWNVDLSAIESRVAKHPWVRRVVLRRELPHRIVIEVEERKPMAIMLLGKLYYVDSEGFVFKEVAEGESMDFVVLTGLSRRDFLEEGSRARRRIREALRLAELAGERLPLSEVRFSSARGLILYPVDRPVAVVIGWDDWEAKIRRLERLLELWSGREERLAELDLSFHDLAVAKLRDRDRRRSLQRSAQSVGGKLSAES